MIGNITIINIILRRLIFLKAFKDSMRKLFIALQAHPEREKEIAEMIKSTLNTYFSNTTCDKVFVSKGNECNPFGISVIPVMPKENILKVNNISTYDIDIDLDSFVNGHNYNGFDADELIAWLVHELAANVFTDETLLRYKKLLIKYYDTNNSSIMDAIRSFGKLLWIGIFSRTKKSYIDEDNTLNTSPVNATLIEFGLGDSWDCALTKYICNIGGTNNVLSDEYLERMDKTQLREFNELARKYSSYVLKYNNTDYSTMINYIINSTNSKLVEYYTKNEPDQIIMFKEKDIYNIFDDRRLLLEEAEVSDNVSLLATKSAANLQSDFDNLLIDSNNIETASDKIRIAVQLKDLINNISEKILSTNEYDISSLSLLREKAMSLLEKLKKSDFNEQLSILDISDR